MKQLAAEKLVWAILDDCEWLVAITAGDTAAEGLQMYVGDLAGEPVETCDAGCAAIPRFDKRGTRLIVRPNRKGPGCGKGCCHEYRVEPLTSAFLEGGPTFDGDCLAFHLTSPGSGPTFYPAMSDEEYNVLVAQERLYEAQQLVKA